jgi:Flp pilus assembly protein TadD
MNHRTLPRLLVCAALALATATPFAADSDPSPAPAAQRDKLAAARTLIAQAKWAAAIDELRRLNDSGSADWNNLMGYSHRKAKAPDFAAAARYYAEALRIDPRHRGALEYSGELYLMTGDLAMAEARLASLDQLCPQGCEEQADLRKAMAAFKANGNRHVAVN